MQNMHKLTHDRPLTGVHRLIRKSRGRCWGSGIKSGLDLDSGPAVLWLAIHTGTQIRYI